MAEKQEGRASHSRKISAIGLGYVGLAVAFASSGVLVVGFDIDQCRAAGLNAAVDATHNVEPADLKQASLSHMTDAKALAKSDFYIVTVPTPIDDERRLDLRVMLDRAGKPNGINLWRL